MLKNQLYSNETAVFCKLTYRQDLKKCRNCTFKVIFLCQKSMQYARDHFLLFFFWKNSVDFWHRKLTLKVQFWHFLRPWHYVNLQNTAISFESSWFLSKKIHDLTDINDSVQRSNQSASKFLLWHDLPQSPLEGTKRTNSVVYKPQSICVFLDHFSLT